jgi:two-component system sensor histidine kinase YesM
MILQPIVENGILPGISGSGRRGAIHLRARVEEAPGLPGPPVPEPGLAVRPGLRLVLEVRDNGVGIDPAMIAALFDHPPDTPGGEGSLHRIGLANVMQRIRLNFGNPFGLFVESEPGQYTVVRFHLPVIVRREGSSA